MPIKTEIHFKPGQQGKCEKEAQTEFLSNSYSIRGKKEEEKSVRVLYYFICFIFL